MPFTAYTIDGLQAYEPGLTLHRRTAAGVLGGQGPVPADLVAEASALLPRGVGGHGALGLLTPPVDDARREDQFSELVFELTRRSEYPDRPSRYESLFAFASLEDAAGWRSRHRRDDIPIFSIPDVPDDAFRGDMRLCGPGPTPLVCAVYARWYWQGRVNPLDPPLWELLLPLPVTVGERVAGA